LEEGVKDRPCVVVLLTKRTDGHIVATVLPITHSLPPIADDAVEIPLTTKRRLGLDEARSWVVIDEVNRFVWPGPDLRPVSRNEPDRFDFGILPPSLFHRITEKFVASVRAKKLAIVHRTE
jgi:hypothetical protein